MKVKMVLAAMILILSCGFTYSSNERRDTLIKVYDYNISTSNPVAVLQNAFTIGYEKRMNEIWTAEFSMPADDPKNAECLAFRFVEIFDEGERVELFRILPNHFKKSADGKTITYSCEQVLSTLLDDIMFQYHQSTGYTPTENINFILGFQLTSRWQIGIVDFTTIYDYSWENANVLSALFSLPKAYPEAYQWTWDTTTYPWKLNLIQASEIATARIMYRKNLNNIEKVEDPSYIITRLYPLGYGEGVNQLTIKSVNGNIPYIDADTIGTYGVIAAPFIDKAEENPTTLKAKTQAYLETIKIPRVTYSADASDIYSITGEQLDRIRDTGIMVLVQDEDLGQFTARIVSVNKSDLTGNPGSIKVEISNKVLTAADVTTEIQSKQYINDTVAQGATNIDSNDYQDNCDNAHPAVIKFYIPNECVAINKLLLTYETDKFRAYETGAANSAIITSSEEGYHDHQVQSTGETFNTESAGAHSHTDVMMPSDNHTHNGEVTAGGSHSHTVLADTEPSHTHSFTQFIADYTVAGGTHSHTIPEHTHDINYGIYEFDYLPDSVIIKVDGITIPQTELTGNDINIVPYLSSSNGKVNRGSFHTVEIYPGVTAENPSGLARINAAVIKQIFIQSRGGGNY